MYKIYNIIVGQKNKQLQDKASSDITFQVVKSVLDPIGYLMILNKLCFPNQSEQHSISSLFLEIKILYNTIQHANKNMTK